MNQFNLPLDSERTTLRALRGENKRDVLRAMAAQFQEMQRRNPFRIFFG